MSLDTSKRFLQFQIIDLTTVSGGGGGTIGNPLEIGTDDTTKGALYLYGAATTNGGEIRVYNAADQDSSVDYWTILSNSDELYIGGNTGGGGTKLDIIALDYQGTGNYDCNFGSSVVVHLKEGFLHVGVDNTRQGNLYLYGNATDTGSALYMHTGGDYDGATEFYRLSTNEEFFNLGPAGNTDVFSMAPNGHVYLGVDDTTRGLLTLYGNASSEDYGGLLSVYNSADFTGDVEHWRMQSYQGSLVIGGYKGFGFKRDMIELSKQGGNYSCTIMDWFFDTQTISGTGDIYCNDLYTSGTSVHIGDNVVLSEFGTDDLGINSDIYLKANAAFYQPSGSSNVTFKLSGLGGDGTFVIADSDGSSKFRVSSDGGVAAFDWVNFQGAFGLVTPQTYDLTMRISQGSFNIYDYFSANANVASIDSTGNADFWGNVTVSGTGDFGDTITAGGTTPEIQFSATSGTIGVSGNTDLIQLTDTDVTIDGDLYCGNLYTSSVRAGRDTVASGVDNHTVAFVYNFVNTDYTISVNLANTVDTPPSIYSSIITSTTVSGFSVIFSGDIDSDNYVLHYAVAHD